jgi:hypothetical protein
MPKNEQVEVDKNMVLVQALLPAKVFTFSLYHHYYHENMLYVLDALYLHICLCA